MFLIFQLANGMPIPSVSCSSNFSNGLLHFRSKSSNQKLSGICQDSVAVSGKRRTGTETVLPATLSFSLGPCLGFGASSVVYRVTAETHLAGSNSFAGKFLRATLGLKPIVPFLGCGLVYAKKLLVSKRIYWSRNSAVGFAIQPNNMKPSTKWYDMRIELGLENMYQHANMC